MDSFAGCLLYNVKKMTSNSESYLREHVKQQQKIKQSCKQTCAGLSIKKKNHKPASFWFQKLKKNINTTFVELRELPGR